MNAANNRRNHDFQIAYFLAGSCHTPDGAYSLLCDLREEREMALQAAEAQHLRVQAKRLRALTAMNSEDEPTRLDGQADLFEIDSSVVLSTKLIAAAQAELSTINVCIEKLQPLRKYAHLSDPEAHESCQWEEWKLELIHRAENYMLTTGSISPDHFVTMRQHPAFATEIFPAIEAMRASMIDKGPSALLLNKTPMFDVVALLENKQ